MYHFIFINERNKQGYSTQVLDWLRNDFINKGNPENHFWNNSDVIQEAFEECRAMIVLSERNELVGYMVWRNIGCRAEIVIVEVVDEYRRKGICKKMLEAFTNEFQKEISILTATVIPQSEKIFKRMGWESTADINQTKKFYKMVGHHLKPQKDLPTEGCAVAILSQVNALPGEELEFYTIKKYLEKFSDRMQYFKIELDENHKLKVPIIAPFSCSEDYEGYIGLYFDGKLIIEGKARYLFNNCVIAGSNLLILDRIDPVYRWDKGVHETMSVKHLLETEGFFSKTVQSKKRKRGADKSITPAASKRKVAIPNFFKPEEIAAKKKPDETRKKPRVDRK